MDTTSNTPKIIRKTLSSKIGSSETYFRTSDVTPHIEENSIVVYEGQNDRRSWGCCSCRSQVEDKNGIVIVSVTGWHKFSVSPVGGTYYFVNENGEWVRRTASHKAVKAALAQ